MQPELSLGLDKDGSPQITSEVVNMAQNISDLASSSPASFRMVVPEGDFDPNQAQRTLTIYLGVPGLCINVP